MNNLAESKKDEAILKLRDLKKDATDSEREKIDAAVDIMAELSIFLVMQLTPQVAPRQYERSAKSSFSDDLLNVVTFGFWKR